MTTSINNLSSMDASKLQGPELFDEDEDEGEYSLDEGNVYVQELKKLFDSCDSTGTGRLDAVDLNRLCDRLQLAHHAELIVQQLLPIEADGERATDIDFVAFKRRFVQVLPEIIDLNQSPGAKIESAQDQENSLKQSVANKSSTKDEDFSPGTSNNDNNDVISDGSDNVTKNVNSRHSSLQTARHQLQTMVASLGLAENGYLNRYEARLLCQHIPGLSSLGLEEATNLFRLADTDLDGKLTLGQFERMFLQQTLRQKSLLRSVDNNRQSIPIMTTPAGRRASLQSPYRSLPVDLTLFSSLMQGQNSGLIGLSDLLTYWQSIGVEDGQHILKKLDITCSKEVSVMTLSRALLYELSEHALGSDVLTAAWLTLRSELHSQRHLCDEQRVKAEYYEKEVQSLSSRQNLLIDELDHSQTSIERASTDKLRDLESKHRKQIVDLETRSRSDKEFLSGQLAQLDDQLRVSKTHEAELRTRVSQTTKELSRLRKENAELTVASKDSELLNRELRQELNRATALAKRCITTGVSKEQNSLVNNPNVSASTSQSSNEASLRHKAELLTAQNKRLKDKLDEMLSSAHPNKLGQRGISLAKSDNTKRLRPKAAPNINTKDFISQLDQLKARRQKLKKNVDSLSELESDFEPFFVRARHRRRLNKRQRRVRSESRYKRALSTAMTSYGQHRPSTSSDNETSQLIIAQKKAIEAGNTIGGEQLLARLQAKRRILGVANAKDAALMDFSAEREQLKKQFDKEKQQIRAQCQAELEMLLDSAKRQREEALREQEQLLKVRFDKAADEQQQQFINDRNGLEKKFAQEKMNLLSNLQLDYEAELEKMRESVESQQIKLQANNEHLIRQSSSAKEDELSKQKKLLEESLEGQRHGFEARLNALQQQNTQLKLYKDSLNECSSVHDLPETLQLLFVKMLEEKRQVDKRELQEEREALAQGLQRERQMMNEALELHKLDTDTLYRGQIIALEEQHKRETESLTNQHQAVGVTVDHEKMMIRKELDECRDELLAAVQRCAELSAVVEDKRLKMEISLNSRDTQTEEASEVLQFSVGHSRQHSLLLKQDSINQTDLLQTNHVAVNTDIDQNISLIDRTLLIDSQSQTEIEPKSIIEETDTQTENAELKSTNQQTEQQLVEWKCIQTDYGSLVDWVTVACQTTECAKLDVDCESIACQTEVPLLDSNVQSKKRAFMLMATFRDSFTQTLTSQHQARNQLVQTEEIIDNRNQSISDKLPSSPQRKSPRLNNMENQSISGDRTNDQLLIDVDQSMKSGSNEPGKRTTVNKLSLSEHPALEDYERLEHRLNRLAQGANECERCHLVANKLAKLCKYIQSPSARSSPHRSSAPSISTNQQSTVLDTVTRELNELRVLLSVSDSARIRHRVANQSPTARMTSPKHSVTKQAWNTVTALNNKFTANKAVRSRSSVGPLNGADFEQMAEENFLLTQRLAQTKELLHEQVQKHHLQLQETTRLGKVLEQFMGQNQKSLK